MTSYSGELRDDDPRRQGVLLVGHGTRDQAGVEEFRKLTRMLEERLAPCPVEGCFLELAEPSIAEGVMRLVARGVRRINVTPALLFAAGHAKHDIPEAVAAALGSHPEVVWRQMPHLGCRPEILALSQRHFADALATAGPTNVDLEETLLIMVGRGSSDESATAEMRNFSRLRGIQAGVGATVTAFAALAEPLLEAELVKAGRGVFRRIVVQPHILFEGLLLDRIRGLVGDAARRYPQHQWLVTRHLGAEPELVECLAKL